MKAEALNGFSALFDSKITEIMIQHQEAVTRVEQQRVRHGRGEKKKELDSLQLQFAADLVTVKAGFGDIVSNAMAPIGNLFSEKLTNKQVKQVPS